MNIEITDKGRAMLQVAALVAEWKTAEDECRSTYPLVANTYEHCRVQLEALAAMGASRVTPEPPK